MGSLLFNEFKLNNRKNLRGISPVGICTQSTKKYLVDSHRALLSSTVVFWVVVSCSTMNSQFAHAQAVFTPNVTTGNDIVILTGNLDGQPAADSLDGNDSITIDTPVGNTSAAIVTGGAGDDQIELSERSLIGFAIGSVGLILGDRGNDTITLNETLLGGAGSGTVSGGLGDDSISVTNRSSIASSSTSNGTILGESGNDTILINDSFLGGNGTALVSGGPGNDAISLTNNTLGFPQFAALGILGSTQILGGDGADTIVIDNNVLNLRSSVVPFAVTVSGGSDNDTIILSGTTNLTGMSQILGGTGDDIVSIDDTIARETGSQIDGGSGIDQLVFNSIGISTVGAGDFINFEQLRKEGDGTLNVISNIGFDNQTDVNEGVLELTLAGTITSRLVNINGGTLNTDGNGLSSTARIVVANGAIFNVRGNEALLSVINTGETAVAAGRTLEANSIVNSAGGTITNDGTVNGTTILNGGLLAGTGTFIGNVTGNSGSTVSPGNSIGVQNVVGDFTLNAGSTLAIEVTQGAADQVNVTGAVAINGATLQVDDLAPAATDTATPFIIVNNDGADAVTGSGFAAVVDNLAFLDPTIFLTGGDGNDVELFFTSTENIDLTSVGVTPNQTATGTALNSLPAGDPAATTLLNTFIPLTFEQAPAALDSLSGEIHASSQFAFNSNGLFVGDSITDVLNGFATGDQATQTASHENTVQALALAPGETAERLFGADLALNEESEIATPDKHKFVFSRGLFRDVQIDADGNGAETDIQNRGFIAGGGFNLNEHLTVGVGVGYLNTDVDIDSLASETEADSAIANVFARYQQDGFDVTANFGYIYSDIETERGVVVGALNATALGETDANTAFGNVELGYTAILNRGFALRPFIGGGFSVTNRDGFTETGAGAANLVVASTTDKLGQFTIGAAASTSFNIKSALIIPRVEVAFDQLIGDVTPSSTALFLPGGAAFNVVGTEPGRSRGRVSAGFATKLSKNLTGFVDYQGTFSGNDTEHAVRSGIRFKF